MTIAQKISAKVNAQTEAQAMAVYSGLRLMVMSTRRGGNKAPERAATTMELAGDALENRIGETRFDTLMGDIDAHVYA